jgi:hypothetical protein
VSRTGEQMALYEKNRMRAAAQRATRLYPGPVGEVLAKEIMTWENFGYRLGGTKLVMRLCDEVLRSPLPQKDVA